MIIPIAVFIGVTIAVAAIVLAPKLAERRIVFDTEPDTPCGFGCDMTWVAIKSSDSAAVLRALGASDPTASNWDCGIGTVYDAELGQNLIFISPPVDGWTFVIGTALPHPVGRAFHDKCTPFLMNLAEHFSEVQYFVSYPELDLFAWARLSGGRLIRAFGISDTGVIWTRGRTTREERALGLKLFELRGVRGRKGDAGGELLLHPTEEHVMHVAGQWSMNPTQLAHVDAASGPGIVATACHQWRAELLRRSA